MEKTTPGITEIASAEPMEFIRSDIYHSMTQLAPRFSVKVSISHRPISEEYDIEYRAINILVFIRRKHTIVKTSPSMG